mmetsp:Transcript_31504/g.68095  ORF Transcript_31504/g.68095 Transcript_31504/m.68095 type:complete len:123 (+) Transcript_31504:235-603(+)
MWCDERCVRAESERAACDRVMRCDEVWQLGDEAEAEARPEPVEVDHTDDKTDGNADKTDKTDKTEEEEEAEGEAGDKATEGKEKGKEEGRKEEGETEAEYREDEGDSVPKLEANVATTVEVQ